MNHLSTEQISKVVAGDSMAEEEQHIRDCAHCCGELKELRGVLTGFRSSVRDWAGQQDPYNGAAQFEMIRWVHPARRPRKNPLVWVAAGAMLAVVIAIPLVHNVQERQARMQAEQDSKLIDDVNAQLSRSAPMAMESLMELMPVNGNSAIGTRKENGGMR